MHFYWSMEYFVQGPQRNMNRGRILYQIVGLRGRGVRGKYEVRVAGCGLRDTDRTAAGSALKSNWV